MTLQEFAALVAGDKIDNDMTTSSGVVTETNANGVKVRWGNGTPGNDVAFFYSVRSTAWMHWNKGGDNDAGLGT